MTHPERILKAHQPTRREALICEAHRLLFGSEVAEMRGAYLAARRYQATYHAVMAELHALSAERYRDMRGEFLWASRDHQQAAMQCRGELAQAGGGV